MSIDAVIFKAFPNLKAIGFIGNLLFSLPGDLFKYTPNVQEIYMGGILLEHAGIGLLTGLLDARFVAFDNNLCVDMIANTPALLQELKFKLITQCPPLPAIAECSCKEEIDGLNEEIYGMKEGMGELQNQNVKLQEMIGEVQEGVGELKEKTFELQNENVKLQEMMAEVQEDVGELKEGVSILNDRNVEVQNEIGGLTEAIGELKKEIENVNERVDRIIEGN